MISIKKLIQMAKKWQRTDAMRRKSIISPKINTGSTSGNFHTSFTAPRGHFVVRSMDSKRFFIPLSYLKNEIVKMLFEKSDEEFGLPNDVHITLPVDSFVMEYIISLIYTGLAKDQEKALLVPVRSSCSSSLNLYSRLDEFKCQPIYVR